MTAIQRHLNRSLAIVAVVVGIGGYLAGDRTNWTNGYGFDGRFYGELATNFPSAVFGHGATVPPGLGPYKGPHISGVDSYYAFRIVPSAIVWLGHEAFGLEPSHAHVVLLFALLAAGMFGVAMLCWCLSADLLGLGQPAKLVGAIALLVNFALLRHATYFPVLTDQAALGFSALSLYLWLRRATLPLVACTIAGAFTLPVQAAVGVLLLLFPPPANARNELAAAAREQSRARRRPARFGVVVGAAAALIGVGALIWLQVRGYRSAEGTDQLPLFPLSTAIVGLYVFAVVAFLLPPGGFRELWNILRSVPPRRVALAVGLGAGILIGASLIARRPGYDTVDLFKDAFWSTTLDPGLFAVVFVCFYGPLLLLLGDLSRVAADAWRLGPAMVGTVGIGLLGALLNQPRGMISTFPFLLLAAVLAARRRYALTARLILTFLGVSLLLARAWLPIGTIGLDISKLQEFPAQRYFMSTGAWTSPLTYSLQLAGLALAGLALWLASRAFQARPHGEIRSPVTLGGESPP